MLAKPISLILVFTIAVINAVVLLLPFMVIALPFADFDNHTIVVSDSLYARMKMLVFLSAFLVSFLMLLYLLLDFLFGFSVRTSLKKCKRYEKLRDFDFLGGPFEQVKEKFNQKTVRLYIKNSDEVNAYAVSSVGSKAIVLTRGLINKFLVDCSDSKKFVYALRSIMAHEMSHLVNKDFLPSFLIIANQKATNFTSTILRFLFNITARILSFMPYGGRIASFLMADAYSILNRCMTFFNRVVVYNTYSILRKFISRSIEYRCDMQSAKAFGGKNMAYALSLFGESGYFTIFSTHPGTKRRIRRVQHVKSKDSTIHPRFVDSIANYFSIMIIVVICLFFAKQAGVDVIVRQYIKNHETLNTQFTALWSVLSKIF